MILQMLNQGFGNVWQIAAITSKNTTGSPLKSSLYNDVTEYPRGPQLNEHAETIKAWVKETPVKNILQNRSNESTH